MYLPPRGAIDGLRAADKLRRPAARPVRAGVRATGSGRTGSPTWFAASFCLGLSESGAPAVAQHGAPASAPPSQAHRIVKARRTYPMKLIVIVSGPTVVDVRICPPAVAIL